MQPIELNEADSTATAAQIELIKLAMHTIDWPYLEAVERAAFAVALRYHSTAALNRSYLVERGALLTAQATAMQRLRLFMESLKECDELREKVSDMEDFQEEINKTFGGL